ncbi:MAG: hypothetical protein A3B68_08270 [Candidatus Melainabacteria bacterium RIFCSPHIGHO2_02_FULL_34_12]|nr:MAG: hypothetical protein A3B68_08270 [Candidatus Melainabacteria bacterium RIFCSPHIGHO2_02_FULL_34_12]
MVNITEKGNEVKIKCLSISNIDDFHEYYKKKYPFKRDFNNEFISYIFDNPLLEDKLNPFLFVAYNNENNIVGELSCSPKEFYCNGIKKKGYIYHDLYVLEDYRKLGIGTSLIQFALKSCMPAFIIGPTENSLKIFKLFNFEIVEDMNKYLWVKSLNSLIKILNFSLLKLKQNHPSPENLIFPNVLNFNNYNFKLVNISDIETDYSCFANFGNIYEFERSINYLKWRLKFKSENHFYSLNDLKLRGYFVVRRVSWRGLSILEILDYRFPLENTFIFKSMLCALKQFVKSTNIDGIITMSSHKVIDKILKENMFLKIGKPIQIITNNNELIRRVRLKRNLILATLLDG